MLSPIERLFVRNKKAEIHHKIRELEDKRRQLMLELKDIESHLTHLQEEYNRFQSALDKDDKDREWWAEKANNL